MVVTRITRFALATLCASSWLELPAQAMKVRSSVPLVDAGFDPSRPALSPDDFSFGASSYGAALVWGAGETISRKKVSIDFRIAITADSLFDGFSYDRASLAALTPGDRVTLFVRRFKRLEPPTPGVFLVSGVSGRKVRGAWWELGIDSLRQQDGRATLFLNEPVPLDNTLWIRELRFREENGRFVDDPPTFDPDSTVTELEKMVFIQKPVGRRATYQESLLLDNVEVRAKVVRALPEFATGAPRVLSLLMRIASDSTQSFMIRAAAIETLGPLGARADSAAQFLEGLIQTKTLFRYSAAEALAVIRPTESTAALLAPMVVEGDRMLRLRTIIALWPLGRAGRPATASLVRALADQSVRVPAIATLAKFGSAASDAVPALLPFTQDKDIGVRAYAANAIFRIDPARAPELVALLIEQLGTVPNQWKGTIATTLGSFGPAAESALPALRALAAGQYISAKEAAVTAIARIERR